MVGNNLVYIFTKYIDELKQCIFNNASVWRWGVGLCCNWFIIDLEFWSHWNVHQIP